MVHKICCGKNGYDVSRRKLKSDSPNYALYKYICYYCGKEWIEEERIVDGGYG